MSFKDKIEQRAREKNANETLQENDITTDAGEESTPREHSAFFGIENLRNFVSCLDLRLPDGNSKAVPYSYILEINFDASEGIEILTATKKIMITGRNLKPLYNYLAAFRVRYIQSSIGNDTTSEELLFVKGIKIEEA